MGSNESKNLWISLGAAVFAAFMLYSYTQEKKAEVEKIAGSKVRVVVAKKDLRQMDTIFDDAVEVVEKSKSEAEPESFDSVPLVVGSVAAVPIKTGQTITKNLVVEPGPETGMANKVALGNRAVTVPVSNASSNGKMIRPGDRVDIIAAIEVGKGINQRREVTLFAQDIIVLATGKNINNDLPRTLERDPSGKGLIQTNLTGDTSYNEITVELPLEQALDLITISNGSPAAVTFMLRNPADKVKKRSLSSTTEDIQRKLSGQTQPLGQPAPPPPQSPSFPRQ